MSRQKRYTRACHRLDGVGDGGDQGRVHERGPDPEQHGRHGRDRDAAFDRPAKRWELDSNEAIKRSVRAGLGVGFVSRLVVQEELDRGELEAFTVRGAGPMRRSFYLLRPDGGDPTPSERAFIQTLCSCCATSVAGCTAA